MDVQSLKTSLQTPLSFLSHPMCKRTPGHLSFVQRACLLILPCAGLSAAMLVVYIACTCNETELTFEPDVSAVGAVPETFITKTQLSLSGMQQDAAGHFICEHKRMKEGDVGHVVANIAKVVVILVVLLTVTFTLSVASWHVMVTRCTGVQTFIIEHEARPAEVEMIRIVMPTAEEAESIAHTPETQQMIPPDEPQTADV